MVGADHCAEIHLSEASDAWISAQFPARPEGPLRAATKGPALRRLPARVGPWTHPGEAAKVARVRKVIAAPGAPGSRLYSQGVRAGDFIYVSGLVGVDASTGSLAGPSIKEQTRQALANCKTVLQAAGADMNDVVEVGVLLAHPDDFAGMNDEYATCFAEDPPTRYVAKLGVELPGVLVSIRMTAYVGRL